MRFLLLVLCIAIYALIVGCSMDDTPCSLDGMRDMILQACLGHYRIRRGALKTESPKHNEVLHGSRMRHTKQFKVIANETSGGLLIRHKRGTIDTFMYCCLHVGNCTEIYSC